jgi:hypothetical protein
MSSKHAEKGILINHTLDPNGTRLPQTTLGVKGKIAMLDLENNIYNFDQRYEESAFMMEGYYRQDNMKQSVESLISFLFFARLYCLAKNKLSYLKSDVSNKESEKDAKEQITRAKNSLDKLSEDNELKDWYAAWMYEILNFQGRNNSILEKILDIS